MQDKRSGGDNSWSAFDDLATERTAKPSSTDSTQRPESRPSGQRSPGQQAHSSTAPSASGEGWAPFEADSNAFQSEPSAFGEPPAAFQTDSPAFQEGTASGQPESSAFHEGNASGQPQSQQEERQPSGHDQRQDTQQSSSDSWAAFDEDADASQSQAADAHQHSHSKPAGAEVKSQQVDERPLPHADFGESNFWKPHPLALVDDVE